MAGFIVFQDGAYEFDADTQSEFTKLPDFEHEIAEVVYHRETSYILATNKKLYQIANGYIEMAFPGEISQLAVSDNYWMMVEDGKIWIAVGQVRIKKLRDNIKLISSNCFIADECIFILAENNKVTRYRVDWATLVVQQVQNDHDSYFLLSDGRIMREENYKEENITTVVSFAIINGRYEFIWLAGNSALLAKNNRGYFIDNTEVEFIGNVVAIFNYYVLTDRYLYQYADGKYHILEYVQVETIRKHAKSANTIFLSGQNGTCVFKDGPEFVMRVIPMKLPCSGITTKNARR